MLDYLATNRDYWDSMQPNSDENEIEFKKIENDWFVSAYVVVVVVVVVIVAVVITSYGYLR